MNIDHKYILEPYRGPLSRYPCPGCKRQRKFTRYIDTTTGEYLSDLVGRCDREDSCGYHHTPKLFFKNNQVPRTGFTAGILIQQASPIPLPVEFLPFGIFDRSVTAHQNSNLFPFLKKLFGEPVAHALCERFFIGSNKKGDTVFWQVDTRGNIRQAKVMRYNSMIGRRSKDFGADFAGKRILKNRDANLRQCFFGEYQLSMFDDSTTPVAIVESEKTAIIASVFFPDYVWLATGGKNGCKWTERQVCKILEGRKVILFPDLGAFSLWQEKARLLESVAGCKVAVSTILERGAHVEDRKSGLDIVDFLLRRIDSTGLALTDFDYPVMWDYKF